MSLLPILDSLGVIDNIIGRFFPNASQTEKDKLTLFLQENENITKLLAAQAAINANEANNPNLFVSGWRPFLGWGLSAIAIFVLGIVPIIAWACQASGHPVPPVPHFDPISAELLFGMLGINITARSVEKVFNKTK